MIHFKASRLKFIGILFFLVLFCGKKEPVKESQQVLARVGDRIITAEEFRHSYEFGLQTLRSGKNPRKTYLNYMIKELLMANEGFRLGLNNTLYVKSRLHRRKYNDLLEAFIKKYVHGRVRIPEQEIQEAVKKSTVRWKMVVWPAKTLEEAEKVRAATREIPLESYIDNQLNKDQVKLQDKSTYQTGYIDYLDLPPEVSEKIISLEIGKTSEPFPFGDGFAVAQVLDILRDGIRTQDLITGARRKRTETRLHNIAADRIVRSLMDSLLTPVNVKVKGRVVEELAPPLYQWFQDGLPDSSSIFKVLDNKPDSAKQYLEKIDRLLGETLLTSNQGNKSVKEYLEYMDYYRSFLHKSPSFDDFKTRLITEIGRMFKNQMFVDIAQRDGFEDSLEIKEDLKLWEQKWTYDIYRNKKVLDITVTEEEMKDYFKNRWRELDIADVDTTRFYKYRNAVHNALLHEKQLLALERDMQNLRQRYDIWINEKLLQELELVEGNQTPQTSYFLRKSFTTEAALPTVDMKWVGF